MTIGATAATIVAALGPGVASSAPSPDYELSCVAGGQTSVSWKRAKLVTVTVHWVAPAGSSVTYEDLVVPITWHRPSGFVITVTPRDAPVAPERAVVTFEHTNGTTDEQEAACS